MRKTRISKNQIEQKLSSGEYLRYPRKTPIRQSWGEAGVVIQSLDCEDLPERNVPGTKVLRTIHAQAVGRLLRDISVWISDVDGYNYFSKTWFWDQIVTEGIRTLQREPHTTGSQLLAQLWRKALLATERLGRTRTNN